MGDKDAVLLLRQRRGVSVVGRQRCGCAGVTTTRTGDKDAVLNFNVVKSHLCHPSASVYCRKATPSARCAESSRRAAALSKKPAVSQAVFLLTTCSLGWGETPKWAKPQETLTNPRETLTNPHQPTFPYGLSYICKVNPCYYPDWLAPTLTIPHQTLLFIWTKKSLKKKPMLQPPLTLTLPQQLCWTPKADSIWVKNSTKKLTHIRSLVDTLPNPTKPPKTSTTWKIPPRKNMT